MKINLKEKNLIKFKTDKITQKKVIKMSGDKVDKLLKGDNEFVFKLLNDKVNNLDDCLKKLELEDLISKHKEIYKLLKTILLELKKSDEIFKKNDDIIILVKKIDLFFEKINFIIDKKNSGPYYLNILKWMVPIFLYLYKNVSIFSQQSAELLNQVFNKIYNKMSNHFGGKKVEHDLKNDMKTNNKVNTVINTIILSLIAKKKKIK